MTPTQKQELREKFEKERMYPTPENLLQEGYNNIVKGEFNWFIENLPKDEYKWISVEDQLPKNLQSVIAYINGCGACNLYYENGVWMDDGCDSNQSIQFNDVTHWMPLPGQPKI